MITLPRCSCLILSFLYYCKFNAKFEAPVLLLRLTVGELKISAPISSVFECAKRRQKTFCKLPLFHSSSSSWIMSLTSSDCCARFEIFVRSLVWPCLLIYRHRVRPLIRVFKPHLREFPPLPPHLASNLRKLTVPLPTNLPTDVTIFRGSDVYVDRPKSEV